MNYNNILDSIISRHQVPKHNITGFYLAKIIDVYDGDTCFAVMNTRYPLSIPDTQNFPDNFTLCVNDICKNIQVTTSDLHNGFREYSIRMLGYNSEEIRQSKTNPNREQLKQKALQQKNMLCDHVLGKKVILHAKGLDKYGRVLAEVYKYPTTGGFENPRSVNLEMLKHGGGEPYM